MLTFKHEEYELYCPSRADRDQWVRMFDSIAEMNKNCTSAEHMTPFEWLDEKENKAKKREEEIKMTESARVRASETEL